MNGEIELTRSSVVSSVVSPPPVSPTDDFESITADDSDNVFRSPSALACTSANGRSGGEVCLGAADLRDNSRARQVPTVNAYLNTTILDIP